jgi:hypothetical protein
VALPGIGALPVTSLPIAHTLDFLDPESDGSDTVWYGTFAHNLSNANPNGQSTLQIDKAVDFYWCATTVQASLIPVAGGDSPQTQSTIQMPLVNILISDQSSQRSFGNIVAPLAAQCGISGENPLRWVAPRRISAQTLVLFAYTAIVTAAGVPPPAYDLYTTLHGFTLPAR